MEARTKIRRGAAVRGISSVLVIIGGLLIVSAGGCARVSQNESAIQTTNGVISDDHVTPGLQWYWTWFGVNHIEYPRITHTVQSLPITAIDKGQQCDRDCVTLQTHDNQTVTGSLVVRYHVARGDLGKESVMAELYRVRGATSQLDLQEKLIVPPILDCMINVVNHTDAKDLVEKDADTIKSIKDCIAPRIAPYHVVVEEVFNRGFGPSSEARASMRKFSDARQEGQVAQIQLDTAEKRQQAAIKNADVIATSYNQLSKQGIPKEQVPQLICLADAGSKERPCIPQTAMGTLAVAPR
jgi:regulator of protease activity HflC (stomatin/prohibitin superfamily)